MTILLQGAGLQAVSAGGDPIGDALRAAVVACWRFEEADNSARIDSKNGISLVSHDPTIQVAGKIGKAFRADSANNGYLNISNAPVGLRAQGRLLYFTLWTAHIGTSQSFFLINKYSIDGLNTPTEYTLSAANDNTINLYNDTDIVFVAVPPNDGAYHFVEAVLDSRTAIPVFYIAVDHADFTSAIGTVEIVSHNEFFEVGASFDFTGNQDCNIDELGIFSLDDLPTQEQRNYLWNSGAARALYP